MSLKAWVPLCAKWRDFLRGLLIGLNDFHKVVPKKVYASSSAMFSVVDMALSPVVLVPLPTRNSRPENTDNQGLSVPTPTHTLKNNSEGSFLS